MKHLLRSRYISALSSMAMMADIPDNVLFRVLSHRIHLTNLMPCIHDVNSKDANDNLKFNLADEDWRQWKVSVKLFSLYIIQVFSFKVDEDMF